jgi:hypothetical protein
MVQLGVTHQGEGAAKENAILVGEAMPARHRDKAV